MYWEAKRFKKHSISGIKMCCGAKCSEEQSMSLQSVLRKKVFCGAKCGSALDWPLRLASKSKGSQLLAMGRSSQLG